MTKQISFLLSTLLFISINTKSQEIFTGKVTDANNVPISYASISILNANINSITDKDGLFKIKLPASGKYQLEVSHINYASIHPIIKTNNINLNIPVFIMAASLNTLDELVVTAQKQEELIQKIPASITAINSKQVSAFGLWNTKEITGIIPNLYSADPGDGRDVTSVRGIATTSYDPTVTTYIDGVNQFSLDTYIPILFDIERIEVLRGPQGTLYGRNAMGGVINIITKQPTNTPSGFADISRYRSGTASRRRSPGASPAWGRGSPRIRGEGPRRPPSWGRTRRARPRCDPCALSRLPCTSGSA